MTAGFETSFLQEDSGMLSRECPVCCGKSFNGLIDFHDVPRSGLFLGGAHEPVASAALSFEFCSFCSLIRSTSVFDVQWDYAGERRITGPQLPVYLQEVAAELKTRAVAPDDLIFDVGGNDGEFLNMLDRSGWRSLLNIEPARVPAEICFGRGHMVENVYLDSKEASRIRAKYGPAKAVFCRHVLEHVRSPLSFLEALKLLVSDKGAVFIETPDARGIIHDLFGHELWDQHLYHFTENTLEGLLARSGLRVGKHMTRPHRGGRNLLVWASPEDNLSSSGLPKEETIHDLRACREFAHAWDRTVESILRDVDMWPKPVICFGASHPQSNYLLFTGIGKHVSLLVDDDPAKIGKWLPVPQPVRIVSAKDLLSGPLPGTILRTAFGCENWMNPICELMAEKGVKIIEPYPWLAKLR